MSIFKGEYEHTIDSKGRVSFPSKLRKYLNPQVQDRFTIVKGLEKCLYLYPEDKWQEVEAQLNKVSSFNKQGRAIKRQFLRYAEDVSLDAQNRLTLSPRLMSLAEFDGKVTFLGNDDHIELWSPELLEAQDAELDEATYSDLFEKVLGGVEG